MAFRSTFDREDSTEIALRSALQGTLQALSSTKVLTGRDVFLALNALGQIARAWEWLGEAEALEALEQCSAKLCEMADLELQLLDLSRWSVGSFSTRDLALMLLALGRIARRKGTGMGRAVLPDFTQELCQRLKFAAEEWEGLNSYDLKRARAEATASLSAASLMLMHCAKDAELHGKPTEIGRNSPSWPLAVIMAWSQTAGSLQLDVRNDAFKALAAITAMVMQQLTQSTVDADSKDKLQWLLEFATGTLGNMEKPETSQLENWHLDSCLHVLAVLDTLNQMTPESLTIQDKSRLIYLETAVVVEATSDTRLPKLQQNNVSFWMRLMDLPLTHHIATKLAFQLHESKKIPRAVRAAIRDFLSCVENREGAASSNPSVYPRFKSQEDRVRGCKRWFDILDMYRYVVCGIFSTKYHYIELSVTHFAQPLGVFKIPLDLRRSFHACKSPKGMDGIGSWWRRGKKTSPHVTKHSLQVPRR